MLKKLISNLKFFAWRQLKGKKFDKITDKYRDDILDVINKFSKENHYIYVGFGTVLKLFRDGSCKRQDLDIVVSRKFYNSTSFKSLVSKLSLKKWNSYLVDDNVAIEKFLYKDECPVEFFVADIVNNEEITYDVSKRITKYTLSKPTISIAIFNGKEYAMPSDKLKYVNEVYGETWNQKISTFKFGKHIESKTITKNAKFVDKKSKVIVF